MPIILSGLGLFIPIGVWSGSCRGTLVISGDDRFQDRGFCASMVGCSRGWVCMIIRIHAGRVPITQLDDEPIVGQSTRAETLPINTGLLQAH